MNNRLKHGQQLAKLRQDATKLTWGKQFAFTMLILHDKFGFTPDQLEEYADHLHDYLDLYANKYVTLPEIAQIVKEETGIDIGGMIA